MHLLTICLLAAGLLALAIGYRKNNRNLLLAAALLLLASGMLPDFIDGYRQGISGAG